MHDHSGNMRLIWRGNQLSSHISNCSIYSIIYTDLSWIYYFETTIFRVIYLTSSDCIFSPDSHCLIREKWHCTLRWSVEVYCVHHDTTSTLSLVTMVTTTTELSCPVTQDTRHTFRWSYQSLPSLSSTYVSTHVCLFQWSSSAEAWSLVPCSIGCEFESRCCLAVGCRLIIYTAGWLFRSVHAASLSILYVDGCIKHRTTG